MKSKILADFQISNFTFDVFKIYLLKFVKTTQNFDTIQNPTGFKFVTRAKLICHYLRDHNFRHDFLDSVYPLCVYYIKVR